MCCGVNTVTLNLGLNVTFTQGLQIPRVVSGNTAPTWVAYYVLLYIQIPFIPYYVLLYMQIPFIPYD